MIKATWVLAHSNIPRRFPKCTQLDSFDAELIVAGADSAKNELILLKALNGVGNSCIFNFDLLKRTTASTLYSNVKNNCEWMGTYR